MLYIIVFAYLCVQDQPLYFVMAGYIRVWGGLAPLDPSYDLSHDLELPPINP